MDQGKSWEAYLNKTLPKGTIDLNEIKKNFKTFDFLTPDKTAVSAKTMDIKGSVTYQKSNNITRQLNKYVDDAASFLEDSKKGGRKITSNDIHKREIHLAIPKGGNSAQKNAIMKSIEYGESKGIKIIVTETK